MAGTVKTRLLGGFYSTAEDFAEAVRRHRDGTSLVEQPPRGEHAAAGSSSAGEGAAATASELHAVPWPLRW